MIEKITLVLGRLPIGWLQLKQNRLRFFAAIAGVIFANVLIFMQLGFLGALENSVLLPYKLFAADIIISASDSNTLSDGGLVARQRMFQALAVPGVKSAAPMYLAKLDWNNAGINPLSLQVIGLSQARTFIADKALASQLSELQLLDSALIDIKSRNLPVKKFDDLSINSPKTIEVNGREINIIGTVSIGGGFDADGYLIVSDQTFAALFSKLSLTTPKHILLKLKPGYSTATVIKDIKSRISGNDITIRSIEAAKTADKSYQTTQKPVGIIFGFGAIIGILVGIVIVYQVLASDVADHIKEYATFKAMGYPQKFFTSIITEEAIILAIAGFIPGIILCTVLYHVVKNVTGLPMTMTGSRAVLVLFGTVVMCVVSGLFASRKLKSANPADLF